MSRKFEVEYVWSDNETGHPIESETFNIYAEDWAKAKQQANELLLGIEQKFLTEMLERSSALMRVGDRTLINNPNVDQLWSNSRLTKRFGKLDPDPVEFCERQYVDTKARYVAQIIAR